jgi:nucleotide-binding universal stress UspA family protein
MKILLATDGSQYSELTAKFLTCLNLSFDDEITIFHVVYWIPFLYDKKSYFGALKATKEEVAPKVIDSVLNILKDVNAKISTAIIDGSPEQCIVDVAAESNMDLIAMGARGIKGIKSFFIGSVTNSVALSASKPVFITKPPGCNRSENLKILFATDGSDHSIATGKLLSEIPFPEDTEITILNVTWPVFLDLPQPFVPEVNEKMIEIADRTQAIEVMNSERIIEQAREYLRGRFNNINVLSKEGDPSTEILETSEELKTDIIAVGCRGLRGIKGMMGSVSRNILTHSKSSVLIGKTCK